MSADSDPDNLSSADLHHGKDSWVDLLDTREAAEVKVTEHEEADTDEPVQGEVVIGNGDRSVDNEYRNVISCADETLTHMSDADIDGADISHTDFDDAVLSDADISNTDVDEAATASSVTKYADIADAATNDADIDEAVTVAYFMKDADAGDAAINDADINETVFVSYFNKYAVIKDLDLDGTVNVSSVIKNADIDEAATTSSVIKDADLDEAVTISSVTNEVNINEAVTMSSVTNAANIDDADIKDADLDEAVTISSVTHEVNIDDTDIRNADLDEAVTVSPVISDAVDDEIVDITIRDAGIWSTVNPLILAVDSSEVDTLPQDKMTNSVSPWCLVDSAGQQTSMPPATLVVGSQEDCDIRIEVGNVDKRHAMMTFDPTSEQFSVQDLGSSSGTFVNDCRIAEQECVILEHQSSIRFGDDSLSYHIEKTSKMEKLLPSHEMPNWAMRDFEAGMAECPGCIAEQGIHHTCGMNHLEGLAHRMIISPDQMTANVHFTDSPNTYLQHNGHHHNHQALPAHTPHCHNKPVGPPKYSPAVGPQWCTHQGNSAKTVNSSNNKTSPPQKQTPHVEYVYSPERPLESVRYMTTPVDASAQQGVLEMPYQPYRLVHHPLQYAGSQRMPLVAPLMPTQQSFVSCSHGSYGDILYAAEQYHRMYNQKPSPDNQYQQYHLVKHMYNVPVAHGNVMYSDAPTFMNSGVMQDMCTSPVPPHCVEGPTQKSTCDAPDKKNHEVGTTRSKSVSTEGLYNNAASSCQGSSGRSSSSRSTPDSPILHRVDKRRSLAGTDSELETVKKCTPLYGQPSWWGGWYDDGNDEKPSQDNSKVKGKCSGRSPCAAERPSSLTLHPATSPASGSPNHTLISPVQVVPPGACWYTVEVIKPVVDLPSQAAVSESYVSESDKLLEDFKQRTLKAALWSPPERDPGPGDNTQHLPQKLQTAKPRINMTGTAFTIDLRDGNSSPEMPKINMGDSLSKFLPHKVRRSFKERLEKIERISVKKALAATAAAKQKNPRWQRRKSTTAVSPPVKRKPFGSPSLQRRCGYLSDGHHSAFSSDNEDQGIVSELGLRARNRVSQVSLPRRSSATERQNSNKLKAASKKTSAGTTKATGQAKVSPSTGRSKEGPSSYMEARQLRHSQHAGKAHSDPKKIPQPKSTKATTSSPHKTAKPLNKSASLAESHKPCRHALHPDSPEDNVSDAGTYTIDCDEEVDIAKSDVLKARNDIDRLFGLETANELQMSCSAPDARTTAEAWERQRNSHNEIDIGKMSLEELMKQNRSSQPTSSERAAISSKVRQTTSYTGSSTVLPQWVCQWSGAVTEVDGGQAASHTVLKHVGGRKLPSVPTKTPQSPNKSEDRNGVDSVADYLPDNATPTTEDESGRRRATISYDGTRGERFTISFDAPVTPPPRHVTSITTATALTGSTANIVRNGMDGRTVDEKTSCDKDATLPVSFVVPVGQSTPDSDYSNEATNRLNAAVLYELMKSDKSRRQTPHNTTVDSRRTHTVNDKTKKNKAPWKRQPSVGVHRNHVLIDDHSESEASCVSDLSTDCSLSSPHGRMKMPLSSMRTNRTFALRRARLNSSESDSSPKLGASGQQEKKPKSRPSSATDASSRRKSDRVSTKKPEEKLLVRKDGGRFSMRVTKTVSSDQSCSNQSSEPRDASRRSKPSSNIVRSLSTTSGVKSQPSSRSNSPRSQEYNSWKRRKEYDPRRAVSEAKMRESAAKHAAKSEKSTTSEKSTHHHGRHAKSVVPSTAPSTVSSSSTLVQLTQSSRSLVSEEAAKQEAVGDMAGDSEDGMEEMIMQLSSEISHDILALARADETEDFTDHSEKSMTISSTSVTRSAFSLPKTRYPHSPSLHNPPNHRSCDISGAAGDCPLDENENQTSHVAVVPSIYHMSSRLKTQADRIFKKLGNRGSQTGGVSPPPMVEGLTDDEMTIDGQLMLTMHNLRHIECHLTAIEEGVVGGRLHTSVRPDNVNSHRNALEQIRRDIIGFRPIEKPSGKTVVTKSCGITEI